MTIVIGFLSGIMGGMGIGGGTLLIPMLTLLLHIDQKIAQSTNLIVFIPLALASMPVHCKHKNVDISIAKKVIPYGIIGAVIGSFAAVTIPSSILKKLFALFLFIMGLKEILTKN